MIPSSCDLIILEKDYQVVVLKIPIMSFPKTSQEASSWLVLFYSLEVFKIIPKVIHYVWLGRGEKSDKIKTCIESWKTLMPDYEIKEWNEDNFDINYNDFTRQSYDKKMYAFTSDVVRLYALYHEGGIYMDTDVLAYKPLDEFLNEEGFTGFEDINYPVTATMGAEKGNPIIKMMLDYYDCVDFKTYPIWTDYIKFQETSTCIYSNILELLGINRKRNEIQIIKHFKVYPTSYFFTKNERIHLALFHRELELMNTYERCMRYKCKLCPNKVECDKKLKEERLTYKPFENLKKLLERKYGNNNSR